MRSHSRKAINRRIKSGRGSGEGEYYQPWLKISDVSSRGMSHRIPGRKAERTHHLLSNHERASFMLVEWPDDIIDVREQFPLLPQARTIDIANEIGVRHPACRKTGEPIVMTTDLLLTRRGGSQLAISVKETTELASRRVRNKLLIERLYWEGHGVEWNLALAETLPEIAIRNMEWMFEFPEPPLAGDLLQAVEDALFSALLTFQGVPLTEVCRRVDEAWNLERGTAVRVVRYALAQKHWLTPLTQALWEVQKPFDVRHLVKSPLRDI